MKRVVHHFALALLIAASLCLAPLGARPGFAEEVTGTDIESGSSLETAEEVTGTDIASGSSLDNESNVESGDDEGAVLPSDGTDDSQTDETPSGDLDDDADSQPESDSEQESGATDADDADDTSKTVIASDSTGSLVSSNGVIQFVQANGELLLESWKTIDGAVYYFDDDGAAVTGDIWIDGKYYLFNEDGTQLTGWYEWDDGTRSYFAPNLNGAAGKNRWTIDGNVYQFDPATRRTVVGWHEYSNGKKAYFQSDQGGAAAKGRMSIDGKVYFFDNSGYITTGWMTWSDGTRSYFSKDLGGAAAKGWWTLSGNKYYFDPETRCASVGDCWINEKYYLFNSSGALQTGWHTWSDGSKSYFASSLGGAAAKGWWNIGSYRYYFDSATRRAATGICEISGNTYFFQSTGRLTYGWYRWSDGRYSYCGNDGIMRFGTVRISLPNSSGAMVTRTFTFDSNGKTSTNLITVRMLSQVSSLTSSTDYMLAIDTTNNYVGVFTRSGKEWQFAHFWRCSTGASGMRTMSGTFSTGYKGYVFGAGYSCYWYTQIYGQVLFHSVLYNQGTFIIQDGRLGLNISHGCVRLAIENAKWIYDKIPRGTTVRIYRP